MSSFSECGSAACNACNRPKTPQQVQVKAENNRNSFDSDEERLINRQINTELYAFYNYLSMFAHYDRDDVALKGFAKYYLRQAYGELDHALKIIRYMNKRGGRCKFSEIQIPNRQTWSSPRDSIQSAMEVEKKETNELMELHCMARSKDDHHLAHYLVNDFMETQLNDMNELGERYTQLNRVGDGAGLYMYDRDLHKEEKKRSHSHSRER